MDKVVEAMARGMVDDARLRNHQPRITDEEWAEIRSTSFGLPSWSHYASQARAAIAAARDAGYVLAPVVATERMLRAADEAPPRYSDLWAAMIAAAEATPPPRPPA